MDQNERKPKVQQTVEVGSEAWWEKRLAEVRGGGGGVIIITPPPRRTDDGTTGDDSTCCDLDSSTSFTWG